MNPKSPIASQDRARARRNRLLDTYSEAKATHLFARFVRNGTWQCPTLTQLRGVTFIEDGDFTNDSRLKCIPPSEVEATTNQRAPVWFIDMLVSHMIESAMVVVLLTLFLPLYLYYRQKRRHARRLRGP